jgi:orotidine-5'-phosphate decarboxylase
MAGPAQDSFARRFEAVRAKHGPLVLGLDPAASLLRSWGLPDDADGLEAFVDVALDTAPGIVGTVKPQSAFFECHGWQGIKALQRLVSGMREAGVLVVLDVKRGDVGSTNDGYAAAYLGSEAPLGADAITVTPYLGIEAMGAFFSAALRSGSGLFVVVRSSNPEGRLLQRAVGDDGQSVEASLLRTLAERNAAACREAAAAGADERQVGPFGAVFTANHGRPENLDLAAMRGLFLAPGLGAQGASPADLAECFASCPDRVLPSASRSLLEAGPDAGRLRDAVSALGDEVRSALAG